MPSNFEDSQFVLASPRNRGWVWWISLIAIVGVGAYFWPAIAPRLPRLGFGIAEQPKTSAARVTPVNTAAVGQRDFSLYLNALGTVTALKTVTLRSRVEGELTGIVFNEGELVEKDQLLATIDERPYQVQKDQAEGQLARDVAALRAAKLNLTRMQQLLEMKIATVQQVDDQLAIVQQYEGAIQADQAQVAQAELLLTYCRILAPISGRIGLRQVDIGNIVKPTDPQGLAVITQLQPISLIFTIPQDEIPRIQKWMKTAGELRVDAYDRELRNCLASGKLLAIDNQVDPANGTVRLKAEFENLHGELFPNQFVNVRLQVERLEQVLIVPTAAVQRGPDGPFVYVVLSDDTVEKRNVTVRATEGGESAVSGGVNAGEQVVISGLDRLQPGAKVSANSAGEKLQ